MDDFGTMIDRSNKFYCFDWYLSLFWRVVSKFFKSDEIMDLMEEVISFNRERLVIWLRSIAYFFLINLVVNLLL